VSGRAAKAARHAWAAHLFGGLPRYVPAGVPGAAMIGLSLVGLYSGMRDRMVGLRLGRPGTRWPRFELVARQLRRSASRHGRSL
jgi:hypothetical protein